MIIAGLSMFLRLKTTSIWPWKPDIVSGLGYCGIPNWVVFLVSRVGFRAELGRG